MSQRRSPLAHLTGLCLRLIILLLIVAVGAVLSGRKLFDRLDEEIRVYAEREFALHFPKLQVSVGAARRREGVGLELERVVLSRPQRGGPGAPGGARPVLELDRVIVRCPTDLTELAGGTVKASALELFGVEVHLAADAEGRWRLETLTPRCCHPQADPIPIALHDVQVKLSHPEAPPLTLVDVHAELLPLFQQDSSYAHWSVRLQKGSGVSRLDAEGQLDPRTGAFALRSRSSRQELQPTVLRFFQELGVSLHGWRPRGVLTQIDTTIWGAPGRPLRYRLSCDVEGARLERDGALPLDNLSAHLQLDSQQLRVRELRAAVAGADLHVRSLDWSFADRHLRADLSLEKLRFDERAARLLPEALRRSWSEHQAVGQIATAAWSVEYSQSQGMIRNMLDIDCRDLSFQFPALPYRFHRSHGTLKLRGRRLRIDLQSPVGGRTVKILGDVQNLGLPASFGWMEMGTDGPVPLEEEMIAALTPEAQRIVRSFRPQGTLKLWGYVHRDRPGAELQREAVVSLEDLSVNYERLPYSVSHISGAMVMNNGDWTFDIRGRNDQARLTCAGDWLEAPLERPHLALRFQGRRVALDAELMQALPRSARQLWSDTQPRGVLDHVQVDLEYDASQRVTNTRVAVWKLPSDDPGSATLSAFVPGLPYRLEELTGAVVFANGRAELRAIRARHNATLWELEGTALREQGMWRVDLPRLVADKLTVDRDVLDCLPPQAANKLASLQLTGPLNIDGRVAMTGSHQDGRQAAASHSRRRLGAADWDLTVDVERGSLRLGPWPVENIRGQMRMRGAAKNGQFAINGELMVDSLQARDTMLYQLKGPVTLDNRSVRCGAWADSVKTRQLQARAFGGLVSADAEYKLDDSQAFNLAATLTNGQLAELSRRAVPVGGRVDGRVGATLVLAGTGRGIHSLQGHGYAELQDARIYEAPLMVNLLQLFAKEPEPSLISNGRASFRVSGDHVYLDQMELEGAVLLKGKGEMTLDREIDLTLYTAMRGRDSDPSRLLFREASRRILEIEVAGTLEEPKITRRAFPELNDTLKRLFPEAAEQRPLVGALPLIGRRWR